MHSNVGCRFFQARLLLHSITSITFFMFLNISEIHYSLQSLTECSGCLLHSLSATFPLYNKVGETISDSKSISTSWLGDARDKNSDLIKQDK